MAFIDAPYAYVQQVAAQRHILQTDLRQNQRIAQQGEAVIKFFITLFKALNELYPTVLEDTYQLTTEEAANLLQQIPEQKNFQIFCQELNQATATNPLEIELLEVLRENARNLQELLEILAVFAQPLSEEEEKKADAFWAKKMEDEVAKQDITWGLNDLFN